MKRIATKREPRRKKNMTSENRLTDCALAWLKELDDFSYGVSVLDRVWNVLFPGKGGKWNYIHVTKYKHSFYITWVNGGGSLEVEEKKGMRAMNAAITASNTSGKDGQSTEIWIALIKSASRWLKVVQKAWIQANKQIQSGYPLHYRYGVVPHAVIRTTLPDVYRLDKDLGKDKTRKLMRLIEDGFFLKDEDLVVSSMTAADYFNYCRIAYIAGRRKGEDLDQSLSGREMYKRYADGRHEGLLDIDSASEQEFSDWIDGKHPKRGMGGHPWEVKRGGNTTHIDLAVSRPSSFRQEGFKVELRCESIGRMSETLRMLLAIHEASLPISIADPEGVRKRLLAQDNIGIVPSYASLHRANQSFSRDKDVYDVMHYNELGRFKRRIAPFVIWEPLPIIRPKDA